MYSVILAERICSLLAIDTLKTSANLFGIVCNDNDIMNGNVACTGQKREREFGQQEHVFACWDSILCAKSTWVGPVVLDMFRITVDNGGLSQNYQTCSILSRDIGTHPSELFTTANNEWTLIFLTISPWR